MCKNKGRGCAYGIKQREYITKDKTSTPTVATEDLFLTFLIYDIEHLHVATDKTPCAFMQSEMEGETVQIKTDGRMMEILTKLDLKLYQKYILTDKVKLVLYVELKKVLYEPFRSPCCSGGN